MLNTFRTKIKFWSHIFLWPVIISFIAFYGWSFLDRPQATNAAATIGDTEISWRDVTQTRQRLTRYYRQIYKDNFDRVAGSMDFNQMALDQLVNQTLLSQVAEEMGVTVSKQEIQSSIYSIPAFQKDGAFSTSRYRRGLDRMNMTPAQYEASVASDIKMQKTRSLIGASAPVTNDELKDRYIQQNVKVDCDYFMFKMPDFKDQIEETPEAIEAYYNANKEEFRVGDQIMVKYITFAPANFEKDVEVLDIDIEDYYDQNFDKYTEPEQIRASHILFKLEREADEQAVNEAKAKADAAIERLNNGEEFSVLAKELSEGPTASNGGDLGFFQHGRMDPAFDKAAWDLELDAVTTEPVRSSFGWHVIKKTEYKEKSWKAMESVKDQIESQIRRDESKVLAMNAAQGVFNNVDEGINLDKLIEGTSYSVTTSDFFETKSPPRDIGYAQNLKDILGNLSEGDISIPVETNRGVYIFELAATKDTHIPEFVEVKDGAAAKFKNGTAKMLAKAEAEKVRGELTGGKSWEDVATEFSLESMNTKMFGKGLSIPGVGGDEAIVNELFDMSIGEISKVKEVRSNSLIFKVINRQDFDQEAFEKEMPKLRQQLLSSRENQVVDSWLNQLKSEMAREGKFAVNSNLSELQ